MFCDNTRDAIKGHCFYAREAGYVNGRPDMFPEIRAAVTAWCCSDALPEHAPGQIVSYVSAHDNYTLWDKLLLVRTDHPDYNVFDPAVLAENRLAAGIYLTCMGIPFLQAGEEFARTKKGEDNSYASSALLNQLDWKRTAACPGLVEYYRGLIGLRNAFPRLSAPDPDTPPCRPVPPGGSTAGGLGAARRAGARRLEGSVRILRSPGRDPCRFAAGRPLEASERRHHLRPVAGRKHRLHR